MPKFKKGDWIKIDLASHFIIFEICDHPIQGRYELIYRKETNYRNLEGFHTTWSQKTIDKEAILLDPKSIKTLKLEHL